MRSQDPTNPIIRMKLHHPRLADDIVIREQLHADLEQSSGSQFTLVSAPAGYGKSTLISSWLARHNSPSAWLSLDESDSDIHTFLLYGIAAVHTIFPDSCQETLMQLKAKELLKPELLAGIFANDLEALADSFIFVLDDFHRIQGTAVPELLDSLLAHPPDNLSLIILSRRDPPLSLGALRAHAVMSTIRARDLRFTKAEAHTFLKRASGRPLTEKTLMFIYETTEGWAAGLRLAAGVLRNRHEEDAFAHHFSGDILQIKDFLAKEVISYQLPTARDWLRKTAILDHFCAPLCEAVCADQDCEEGKALCGPDFIQLIIDSGLPYSALDERRMWYRYHHLVQEFLKRELEIKTEPEERAKLHRRAATWLESQGFLEEAIRHFLRAGDPAAAGRMIVRRQRTIFNGEQWHRLAQWLRELPAETVGSEPELLLLETWLLVFRGEDSAACASLDRLEALTAGEMQNAGSSEPLLGSISAIRSRLSYVEAQAESAKEHAENALAWLPSDYYSERGYALVHLAGAYQMRGDLKKAHQIIYDALTGASKPPVILQSRLLSALCFLDWISADLSTLQQTAAAHIELGIKYNLAESSALGQYFNGIVHYARNKLSDAETYLLQIVGDSKIPNLEFFIDGTLALASVYQARGQVAKAKETVESLYTRLLKIGNIQGLADTQAYQAELALLEGNVAEAFSWAQQFDAEPLRPMYKFYAPVLTLVKVLIAEGSTQSHERAASLLNRLETFFGRTHNTHFLVAVHALKALRCGVQGDQVAAEEDLHKAITLAQPGHLIRVFVDLGSGLIRPLHGLNLDDEGQRYVGQILAAFRDTGTQSNVPNKQSVAMNASANHGPLPEALTRRELQVLAMLAKRLSNKEISAQLFISPATVKRHSENIYIKLGVHNRRDAVAKASALDLFSDG